MASVLPGLRRLAGSRSPAEVMEGGMEGWTGWIGTSHRFGDHNDKLDISINEFTTEGVIDPCYLK